MSVAALQLQLLLAEPEDWLQLLELGRDGCYGRTCLFICLFVYLFVHLFFPLNVFRREGSLSLPFRRLRSRGAGWSWGSALSGAAALSPRPCRPLPGLLAAGSRPLCAPKLGPCVSVCPGACARAGVCTPGKGTCSGWPWVKCGAPSSNFCY